MDIGIQTEGSMGKLAHKVAVVTGASKGIGVEIVRELAAEGAQHRRPDRRRCRELGITSFAAATSSGRSTGE